MADPPPVPSASSPIPPPITKLPIVNLRTGLGTLQFISFLTEFWASIGGAGGLGPTVDLLVDEVAILTAQVSGLLARVAILFGMHGDGTISPTGELTVVSSEGRPFVESAFVDTTNADNIIYGTLDTLQLPVELLQISSLADLPTPSPGNMILCTDLGGGPGPLAGDGSFWERMTPGLEIETPAAAVTLTVLVNGEEQIQAGALAADMVVSLASANAYMGARFRWVRPTVGAGAFTITFEDQDSAAVLYIGANAVAETTEFLFTGIAWVLAQHSIL